MHDGCLLWFWKLSRFKGISSSKRRQVEAKWDMLGFLRSHKIPVFRQPLSQPSLANLELNLSSLWTTTWLRTTPAQRCLSSVIYLNPHLSPISLFCFFFSEGPGPLKPLNWFYYWNTQETLTTHHNWTRNTRAIFSPLAHFSDELYLLSLLSQYSIHYPSDSNTWNIFQRCYMRALWNYLEILKDKCRE